MTRNFQRSTVIKTLSNKTKMADKTLDLPTHSTNEIVCKDNLWEDHKEHQEARQLSLQRKNVKSKC